MSASQSCPGSPLILPARAAVRRLPGYCEARHCRTPLVAGQAFFGPSDSAPIWFRLWVDADGLVRRAEMRAAGHFMDQRYGDFDAHLAIQAPSQTR